MTSRFAVQPGQVSDGIRTNRKISTLSHSSRDPGVLRGKRSRWLLSRGYQKSQAAWLAEHEFECFIVMHEDIKPVNKRVPEDVRIIFNILDDESRKRCKWLLCREYKWDYAVEHSHLPMEELRRIHPDKQSLYSRKPIPKPTNMSVGAQNRYQRLIVDGDYTEQEAAAYAPFPMFLDNSIRKHVIPIAVRIVPEEYPETVLTESQASKMKDIIDQQVADGDSTLGGLAVKLGERLFVDGYLLVPCFGPSSVKWIEICLPKIQKELAVSFRLINTKEELENRTKSSDNTSLPFLSTSSQKMQKILWMKESFDDEMFEEELHPKNTIQFCNEKSSGGSKNQSGEQIVIDVSSNKEFETLKDKFSENADNTIGNGSNSPRGYINYSRHHPYETIRESAGHNHAKKNSDKPDWRTPNLCSIGSSFGTVAHPLDSQNVFVPKTR
ncbi:uncharacterized protein LOC131691955 isoform X2 [Topomyia yanbarensis]|uniref:uncharacterized protein LOC131691955 isoform X2 n=1 Tax=Topomyia yanbarensis TaxID=2498891 RepID=UPI00273BBAFF|nr:uncharacterized protein LOC131691955 isoform X2 [Topomyia yanbarensis]